MNDLSGEFGFVLDTRNFWVDTPERQQQRELNTEMISKTLDDTIDPYSLFSFAIGFYCVLMILVILFVV